MCAMFCECLLYVVKLLLYLQKERKQGQKKCTFLDFDGENEILGLWLL
jgi:hypothetical protein